jgi:hypothetical protein
MIPEMRRLEADTIFRFTCLQISPEVRHCTIETIEHDVLQTRKRWPSSPPGQDVVTGNGILACSSAAKLHVYYLDYIIIWATTVLVTA